MGKVLRIATREASIKRRFRHHLKRLGFQKDENGMLVVPADSKEAIRALHTSQRSDRLDANRRFIEENWPSLKKNFAEGWEIEPTKIDPILQRVRSGTAESDLFRIASLTWSVPVSNGFGRRIRYLVRDQHNQKLIGLIAIGDPVFNLAVRDNLINWSSSERSARLVNVMDAYVLGAVAPYNALLAGKLVACLARSRDVYNDFSETYGRVAGIISGKRKNPRLLALMTSSSLGRSSVYNRLKLGGVRYYRPIGYTSGWGHFHIPDKLFLELRDYLRDIGHPYADLHRFGHGPNWRLRTTRVALERLGFREDLLKHGIKREVFLSELASNALCILREGKGRPNLESLASADEIAALALERWIIPRAHRRPDFAEWTLEDLKALLTDHVRNRVRARALSG